MKYRQGSAGYLISKFNHQKIESLQSTGKWSKAKEQRLWVLLASKDYSAYFSKDSKDRVRVPYMPVFHEVTFK